MKNNDENIAMTVDTMMSFLLDRFVSNLPLSELSNIFDRLIWMMDDNGQEIEKVRKRWFYSKDKRKVIVALNMSEVFSFDTRIEFEECFTQITKKWPDLSPSCSKVICRWDEQHKKENK